MERAFGIVWHASADDGEDGVEAVGVYVEASDRGNRFWPPAVKIWLNHSQNS